MSLARLVSRALFVAPFVASSSAASFAAAQQAPSNFLARYQARVTADQLNQPHWATPLITINARVEQGFRSDFVRQTTPDGESTWNLGNAKGLQIIPFRRVELRISPPPFFIHSDSHVSDGFGDTALRLKFRAYGSSELHRNAIVSVLLAASIPTGKSGNGSCCAVLTPTLEVGKGFGRLALTSAASGTLPASNTLRLGRTVVWNNAIQYHLSRLVWIEDEFNSTFYFGGRNDGRQQTFTTPGLILSHIPLLPAAPGRTSALLLTLGAGEQIALTHFHTYDHSPILTCRLRF
jgi:hypothetical protein